MNSIRLSWVQRRNIFLLSRKYEVPLRKDSCNPKNNLKGRHYVYNLVENTLLRKEPKLEFILSQYIENVGRKGDRVSLKKNVGYNNIILPCYGDYLSTNNVPVIQPTEVETHSSPYAQRTINMLKNITVAVVMNKEVPWVIEPWHIRLSLRKIGIYCKDSCIKLLEGPIKGPNLDIENKKFKACITINNTEEVEINCQIHHWSTDPENRLPYVFEFWKTQ